MGLGDLAQVEKGLDDINALLAGGITRDADAGELGVDENPHRRIAVIDLAGGFGMQHVANGHLGLAGPGRSDQRRAGYVAGGPDALGAGAHVAVDLDEAAGIGIDAGLLQADILGGRGRADGEHQPLGPQDAFLAAHDRLEDHAVVVPENTPGVGLENKVDVFAGEDLAEQVGQPGVELLEQSLAAFENGDAGAEARKHLSHLQGDDAAADDQQRLGEAGQVHGGVAGQVIDLGQAGDVEGTRIAAAGQKEALRRQGLRPDAQLPRRDEPTVAAQDANVRLAVEDLLVVLPAQRRHRLALDLHQAPAVRQPRFQVEAECRPAPGGEAVLGLVDQRLARYTAPVDAGAAEVALLHHQDLGAFAGRLQRPGEGGGSGAEYDDVVGDAHWLSLPFQVLTMLSSSQGKSPSRVLRASL